MKRPALIIALLFCAAAVRAQAPAVTDCGAAPAADACAAKPRTADIFGLPAPSTQDSRAAGKDGLPIKRPSLTDDTRPAGSPGPAAKRRTSAPEPPAGAPAESEGKHPVEIGEIPDFSPLERASTSLHIWLGLALALLALSEAFAADNPGRAKISLAGCALSAALALGALAASAAALGPAARELLAFRPGFLLYYAAALLAASAALSQLLSRHSGKGAGFWGGAAAFFLAAAGAVLLAVQARVNPEAATAVMAGHVPVGAALLAAGAARAFLLFTSAGPARAALPVFLFIAAAMSGLYRESPDAFSLHFSTMTGAAGEQPADGAEKAAAGRTNEEAADKKGPRG
ncbi:MAG: hypothetical protein RDU13_10200 [Elusimicrobiales bacterium]|nr:hypothetical protein [Elusimicrobiales bacterium]